MDLKKAPQNGRPTIVCPQCGPKVRTTKLRAQMKNGMIRLPLYYCFGCQSVYKTWFTTVDVKKLPHMELECQIEDMEVGKDGVRRVKNLKVLNTTVRHG